MIHNYLRRTALVAAAALSSLVVACKSDKTTSPPPAAGAFAVTNLVSDVEGTGATTVDANLRNAWGIAFGPTGILWVSNAETGTSTLYDGSGAKQATTVTIPSATAPTGGAPTGLIYNSTSDFKINGTTNAPFIFAGEDGVISAWSPGAATGTKVADRSTNNAVYKGIAIAADGGANFLFATNFKNNQVDVFDGSYAFVKSFTDATIPAGYAPFGIQNIDGKLFVTFAKQHGPDNVDEEDGAGLGYVVVFNTDGTVDRRFASTGNLDAPWGIARAPAGFGDFAGAIIIGNFGDGRVGVYNNDTGAFMGFLTSNGTDEIAIDGLWGLTFGVGANATKLYFSAGPGDEQHGLIGTITVKPAT